jgi:hypothetical protein
MVWLRRAENRGCNRTSVAIMVKGLLLGLLSAAVLQPAFADDIAQAASPGSTKPAQSGTLVRSPVGLQPNAVHLPARANFQHETASPVVRHLADRIVETTDNHRLPFVIVDKVDAKVFVFDAAGKLRGAAPALLGLTLGDDSVAAIRDRKLADIGPSLRITPAGRFVASLGHDAAGKEILWVDYDDSIAMHPVVTSNPAEHRLQRLASPTPLDHRISWGCINVPRKFYESVVSPAFVGTQGIVYVLPEIRIASDVFGFE